VVQESATATVFARVTAGQEGLFVVWKQRPDATNYTVAAVLDSKGGDIESANTFLAVRRLVGVHSGLRTKRYFSDGKNVLQEVGWKDDEFDWQRTAVEGEAEARAALVHDALQAWDLESGRAGGVMRVRATENTLVVWMHHILADEWSMQVLDEDFGKACGSQGELEVWAESAQLWEFAEWEWEVLQREGAAMSVWWCEHLKGCKALRLCGDMADGKSSAPRAASCRLAEGVVARAQQVAQTAGVSLFAVWQGVFAMWALRHMDDDEEEAGNSRDVLVVGPYGRRDMAQFQRTVGYLLNMVVYRYRADLLVGADLIGLARESRCVIAEAIERGGNYPFSRLVREAGVENSERLMDVMFNWVTGQELEGFVGASRLDSKNAFTLHCDGVTLAVESTLFESSSKLHDVLSGMMRVVAGGSGVSNEKINVERALQEEEWGTGPTLARAGIVPVTFQGVVRKFMKSKLETKLVDLSWVASGKAGDVIGMHMRRSERLVWLTYSITLPGFAFLPLDAQYGAQVVEYRLRDSEAAVCCVDDWRSWAVCVLVIASGLIRAKQTRLSWKSCFAEDKGYMFYTSGSTGNPKGVLIGQQNVPVFGLWLLQCDFQVVQEDLFVWQASISFDTFVPNILWPLLLDLSLAISITSFHAFSCPGSLFWMTPSSWMLSLSAAPLSSMRALVFGGEPVSSLCAQSCQGRGLNFFNVYGPTETTVIVTSKLVKNLFVTIGRPINGSAIACRKSLFVQGRSVGPGYCKLQRSTKSKFTYDGQTNDGVGKQYDTGDAAEFLNNGDLSFSGRLDDQVKISGQRVELGAVESAVLSCAGVKQCAVLVVEQRESGSKSLAAFVVVANRAATDASAIREHVARSAVRHEVPHQVIVVDSIPLTTAGKADRLALRMLLRDIEKIQVAPKIRTKKPLARSNSRKLVEEATKKVFGASVEGTIWEAGASSLMAMQLDAAIKEQTGVQIGLSNLMKDGSVDMIASMIDSSTKMVEEGKDSFYRMQKFGAGPTLLFISGFGLLAETASPTVNSLAGFTVCVCEFAGLNYDVSRICELFLAQIVDPVAIVAHSAGGVWAYEFAKMFPNAVLVMLDCYIPPLSSLDRFGMLRFLIRPFQKMSGLASVEDVPNDYLAFVLRGVLKHQDEKVVEAYCSEGQLRMQERMNQWSPEGRLSQKWIFVKCSTSAENVVDEWKPFFEQEPIVLSVEEDHFDMLKTGGPLILPYLNKLI
jgi:acyl-coenzyme A synthetase/AMP-(fatty) acid ligase